jgi:isopentenyl diphosphate isomerase/L-lactate dehydrogenase-like FMN-dependent dehydrogenase
MALTSLRFTPGSREIRFLGIAGEPNKLKIPFAGHVPFSVPALEASDAGMKSMEHLHGVVLSCSAREDELRSEMLKGGANLPGDDRLRLEMHEAAASYDDRKAAPIFAHLAKNKTWQVPTLVVRVPYVQSFDTRITTDPRLKYIPPSAQQRWTEEAKSSTADSSDVEMQAAVMHRQMDASFSWDDFNWLRKLWPRKLLVKGIMRPDDAERCIDAGADGVILSNHGGRQLDVAVSPLDVLAESRTRISAPILIDSGYRRGTDIVKALALGANVVLLGRAPLYGLAAAGEVGVDDVVRLLKDEVDRTLAQIGCASASRLSPDYVLADGPMPTTTSPSVRTFAKVSG